MAERLYKPINSSVREPNHVASIRLAHVQWFLQEYYVPNNATLAIVGDVDPARALASVERYFASIPPSRDPLETPARAVVRLSGSRFVDFEAPTHTENDLHRATFGEDVNVTSRFVHASKSLHQTLPSTWSLLDASENQSQVLTSWVEKVVGLVG